VSALPHRSALTVIGLGSRSTLFEKAIGNAGLNGIALLLNVVITVLLSRLAGASGYGTYAFAVALANLLAVPAMLGLPALVVREVAAHRVDGSWGLIHGVIRRANEAVVAASVIVCAAAAGVFVAVAWPHGELRTPSFVALALIPLTSVVSIRQGVMQGFGHVVVGRVPETAVSPLLVIVLVVGFRLALGDRFSPLWAVAAAAAALAAATALGMWLQRRTLPFEVRNAPPAYATRRWAAAAVPLLLLGGIGVFNDQIATVLLGSLGTAREVGLFGIASRIAGFVPFLLIAAVPTLMPRTSELYARGEAVALQRLTSRAGRLVFCGTLPLFVLVVAAATPLVHLFGGTFPDAATPLRILALGQLVNVLTGFAGMILVMVDAAGLVVASIGVAAVANVSLNLALDGRLGATGAAVAVATSVALANCLLSAMLWRTKRIWAPAVALPRTT
jgi:O-antigen/teichoic acid export membrane protein